MDLVQWIVPDVDDGSLAIGWAPVWADRVPSLGAVAGPLRRRGAPLVSRWLAIPLAIAGPDKPRSADDDAPARRLAPASLGISFLLAVDDAAGTPLLPHKADAVRFAVVLGELVRVIADLSEAAGVPATHIAPTPERNGIDLVIGALGAQSALQLADALLLLRVAVEGCAQARGLAMVSARVRIDDKSAPLDGRVCAFLRSDR